MTGADAAAPVHVVVGPPAHGVTEHSLLLAGACGAETLRAERPDELRRAVADLGPGRAVHLGFTDRLWGTTPAEAAETVRCVVAGKPYTATLHDIPQPSDGEPSRTRRVDCFAAVAASARAVAVASRHERGLLRESGIDARPAVVPLPIPELPPPAENPLPGLDRAAVLFGFVYPGKGHAETVDALSAAGLGGSLELVALGACSPGHESMATELAEAGRARGVRVLVAGYVPAGRLLADLRAAAVPVAPHRHVSASGSIATWLAAGRRPLVAENRYTCEVAARWPGCVTLVPDDGWPAALARAVAEPPSTVLDAVPEWGWRDVAEAYRRWWAGL